MEMTHSGLDYLLEYCKIQKGERIGDIKAVDFKVSKDATQMGHLTVICKCYKHKKQFSITANILNWKITKFLKKSLKRLDYESVSGSARTKHGDQ